MAISHYARVVRGTAIIWGHPGASGVTHDLSLDALANGSAQQGEYADLGENAPAYCEVYVVAETGTAPTAGLTVDVYLVCSHNGSDWPAKVTGADASYTLGTSDANLKQAGNPAACLIATNDGNTVLRQSPTIWVPRGRYVAPIYDNNLGQALRNETTDTDNGSRIILIPIYQAIEPA